MVQVGVVQGQGAQGQVQRQVVQAQEAQAQGAQEAQGAQGAQEAQEGWLSSQLRVYLPQNSMNSILAKQEASEGRCMII
jgi:hypothetical protein